MNSNTKAMQTQLKALGFDPGELDGIDGPKTQKALKAFKAHHPDHSPAEVSPLPWMKEITKVYGLHEVRDNGALTRWLRSDGALLGDPSKLPWCGDAVETAVKRGIPNEKLPARLQENPYWARNWGEFGVACGSVFGAVATFRRGSGGHVAFLVGINKTGSLLRVRGGNQSNEINDTWIETSRLLRNGLRWPSSVPTRLQKPVPVLNRRGGFVSRNEA